jgi:hypothetical protein
VTFLVEVGIYEIPKQKFYDLAPQEGTGDADFLLELALATEMFPNNTTVSRRLELCYVTQQTDSGQVYY